MTTVTILIIDDEYTNLQLISSILEQSNPNYKILTSTSSLLGLEIAKKTIPDLIISDWNMPELNGIELILELKKNYEISEIPVIIATCNNTAEDLSYALENGATDYIMKPINRVELVSRINATLRKIEFYNQKTEKERNEYNLHLNKLKSDLELKEKQILNKSLSLFKINKSNVQFQSELLNNKDELCRSDCKIFSISRHRSKELIDIGNKSEFKESEMNLDLSDVEFYKTLIQQFPFLTQNERKLCSYLRINLSTKDISIITGQSKRSIEIARTRLREKFGIKGEDIDLHSFLLNY